MLMEDYLERSKELHFTLVLVFRQDQMTLLEQYSLRDAMAPQAARLQQLSIFLASSSALQRICTDFLDICPAVHTPHIEVGGAHSSVSTAMDCLDGRYLNNFLDTSIDLGKLFTYLPSLRRLLTYGLRPNPFIYALDPSEYEDNACPCPTLDTLKLHNPRSSIPRSSFLPQILKNREAVAVPITKQVFSVQQPAYIPSDEKDPGEESDADDD